MRQVRRRRKTTQRLAAVRAELARQRDALRILDEQLAFVQGVADDAVTQALVTDSPATDRDRREAEDDLRRLQRERDETARRVAQLAAEQDQLLDQLLEQDGT